MHVASDGRERKARICRGSVGKKSYFIHKMSRIQNGVFFFFRRRTELFIGLLDRREMMSKLNFFLMFFTFNTLFTLEWFRHG